MSEGPAVPPVPKPKPPGKIAKFFKAIFGWPKKLWRLSVPAKAAIVVTLALATMVVVAWTSFLTDSDSVNWRHTILSSPARIVAVICLLALIPLVVYRGLKLWLEGDISRFPDLDFAWKAGITALERNGIDITAAPIFLVVGSSGERQERALFDAAGLSLRVRAVPEGPAPLHWYASPDAVYLCCTEASWTSALAAYDDGRSLSEIASILPNLEAPAPLPARTGAPPLPEPSASSSVFVAPDRPVQSLPPQPAPAALPAPSGPESIRGTIMLDQYAASLAQPTGSGPRPLPPKAPAAAQVATAASGGGESTDIRGTMMLEGTIRVGERGLTSSANAAPAAQAPHAPQPQYAAPQYAAPQWQSPASQPQQFAGAAIGGQRQSALLSPQDSAEQLERLQYVCQLLRRAREPLCAINGVLTLLPLRLIQGNQRETDELQRAVRSDMRSVGRVLELQCPVTALVVGMEEESGFRELVRRVGHERATVQRFGQRYDLRSIATAEEMSALCAHVCGAFEDWVYTLFREQGALSRPGNTQLYGLLCKVRLTVKHRLSAILAGAFGYDPHRTQENPVLFSGCYFAAIGNVEDRQAFVKGVFNKLAEEQEQIEWTPRALRNNRRYLWAAYLGFGLDAALALLLGWMIATRLFFR
ncbi:MAG TPA: type VI secretion protein IcmF/TssM N-terminal domain-containing protein [Pirellulales bacterium]|nr:type VI secretion protein IcmF/TssM N-terminal domain-containing protein [Pirellulales bacterium]